MWPQGHGRGRRVVALRLLRYPDPKLRMQARRVERADGSIVEAVPRMFEVMYKARGIGLAATQVGLDKRVIVANLSGDPLRKDQERVFVNPEILGRSGERHEEEGCLSLPGMSVAVPRACAVDVRYLDLEGNEVRRSVEGLEAKLFEHEIDHLDGVLIIDKMTPADRRQWAQFLKELEREYDARARRRRGARSESAL